MTQHTNTQACIRVKVDCTIRVVMINMEPYRKRKTIRRRPWCSLCEQAVSGKGGDGRAVASSRLYRLIAIWISIALYVFACVPVLTVMASTDQSFHISQWNCSLPVQWLTNSLLSLVPYLSIRIIPKEMIFLWSAEMLHEGHSTNY